MRRIFISYRHDDTRLMCDRIYAHLATIYGNPTLFRDLDNLAGGEDFREALARGLSASAVMLVIIGPTWLTATNAQGQRRLFAPTDYVRNEIETALEHHIPIIPVLVGGAAPPSTQALPPSITPLAYQQARTVRPDPDFQHDMQVVINDLTRFVPLVPPTTQFFRRLLNQGQRVLQLVISLALLLLTVNAVLNYLNQGVQLPGLTELIHHFMQH